METHTTHDLSALADRFVGQSDSPYTVPGAGLLIEQEGRIESAFRGNDAAGAPMTEDSIFPLASATKLATGLAVLRMVDAGALDLDAPIAAYLSDAAASHDGVTVRALLTHRAGLPLDLTPTDVDYAPGLDWQAVAAACLRVVPVAPVGAAVRYSNVGFGLLAIAAERVTGTPFARLLRESVLEPLGVEGWFGEEPPRPPVVIGDIRSPHTGTELEPVNSAFWRSLALPWAGLFATATGFLDLLRAYGDDAPVALLSRGLRAEARTDQTAGLDGGFPVNEPFLGFDPARGVSWRRCAWGLSVEVRGTKRPHWTPSRASVDSYGQIGSSGCLAWCDPEAGVRWVLLGAKSTDGGWLLRHAPAVSQFALRALEGAERG